MEKKDIAMIGLGPMGSNLSLNIESKGYSVSVYDVNKTYTNSFISGKAKNKKIFPYFDIHDLVTSLKSPKKIFLMIKSGNPVDEVIVKLLPLLTKGDLIIDGGNSYFKDTIRRSEELSEKGILYIGAGISGGEEGALKGPAIMPGGPIEAYNLVKDIFNKIAGKAEDRIPCASYIGPGGAGHFVKMVHNGIEYGDMQLIGECVWTLKNTLGLSAEEISDILFGWNKPDDVLNSYLIEITGKAMRERDKGSSQFLVDRTADITRMKGTGTWTVQSALELLVPIPTITSAVFSREMSENKDLRLIISKELHYNKSKYTGGKDQLINMAHDSLYISKISSYAQGFALLEAASRKYDLNLDMSKIAKGWRAGCIIRAQFLNEVAKGYEINPDLSNLLAAPEFKKYVNKNIGKLASFINIAHEVGVPVMAMDNAYDYIIQMTSPIMISAQVSAQQRDYFGAHGYFKLEESSAEVLRDKNGNYMEYHTEWMEEKHPEKLL